MRQERRPTDLGYIFSPSAYSNTKRKKVKPEGNDVAGKFYLLQLAAVQQAKPGPVITVQQAKNWKEHGSKKNKTKLENVQQPQAQPHIRSSVDHEADHTSGQSPVMRTATNHVTRQHMIIT